MTDSTELELGEVDPDVDLIMVTSTGGASEQAAPLPASSSDTFQQAPSPTANKMASHTMLKVGLLALVVVGAVIVAIVLSTSRDNGDSDGKRKPQPDAQLNTAVVFPLGTIQVQEDAFTFDETLTVSGTMSGGALNTGANVTMTFNVGADTGFVGIRFGTSGPINQVPVNPVNGQASFSASIPSSICDELSSICHDIACYEFAISSDGTRISSANINDIALVCGGCSEPSCRGVIDSDLCTCDEVNDGFTCETGGGCIPRSYVCDRLQDCSDNSDERGCTYTDPDTDCVVDCLTIFSEAYGECNVNDASCLEDACNELVRCYNTCGGDTLESCT